MRTHVKGSGKEGSEQVIAQGSFRVIHGDATTTLNVVKVAPIQSALTPLTLLRSTPTGARLWKGESVRDKGKQTGTVPHTLADSILVQPSSTVN
jgi:hypothetical protein